MINFEQLDLYVVTLWLLFCSFNWTGGSTMKYFTNRSVYTIKVVMPILDMIYIFPHIDPPFIVSLIESIASIFIYVQPLDSLNYCFVYFYGFTNQSFIHFCSFTTNILALIHS